MIENTLGLKNTNPIKLIVADVDGTLVSHAKTISAATVAAVETAMKRGIRVAIASGRAWNEMSDVIEALPELRYFMCTNGAVVIDKQEQRRLVHESFDKKQALSLLDKLTSYGLYVEAYMGDHIYGAYDSEPDAAYYFRDNIRPFVLKTRTFVPNLRSCLETFADGPEKLQIFYGRDGMRERILEDLRDASQGRTHDEEGRERFYDVLVSSEGNIEFVLPHTTKGTAVAAMAKHWQLSPEEVMTIGDSENDISMLTYAGCGTAMGNAPDYIQRSAKYVTLSNDDDGAARAVYSAIARNEELGYFTV